MTLKAQSGCQIPGKHAMIKKQKVFIYFHLNISTFSAACAMWKGNSDWNMNFTPQISGLKDTCRWPQASVKRSVFSLRLSSVARIGDVGVLASQVPAWWHVGCWSHSTACHLVRASALSSAFLAALQGKRSAPEVICSLSEHGILLLGRE